MVENRGIFDFIAASDVMLADIFGKKPIIKKLRAVHAMEKYCLPYGKILQTLW